MSRIAATFEQLKARREAALIPYLMAGYPSLEGTKELLDVLVDAGADLVELGIPFSDPMADGATLQRINHLALEQGTTLRGVLDLVASVRERIPVPIVLMSYYNPVLRLGDQDFARRAGEAGVDGLIVPDLPVEEAGGLRTACGDCGIDMVGMVAPTSSKVRIEAVACGSTGFMYCVALKGVTGARGEFQEGVETLVRQVKDISRLPAVVGFGMSTPDHVRRATVFADGVVVASALLDAIDRAPGRQVEAAREFVLKLKAATRPI